MNHPVTSIRTIGRFEIVRELGQGAFGTVYLAKDPQLERLVALKVPNFSAGAPSRGMSRFLSEAKAAAALHHPNIVAVHDAGKFDDSYYIASAYIEGKSLREMLRLSGKPSPAAAARLIARLADALRYAHRQGVIHRDVKPENVLLDSLGTPYLVDFGLARRERADVLKTQDGTVLGTPAYMSPEQAAGQVQKTDGASDQWALGVMLYELLTGKRPFEGNQMELLYAIRHKEPQAPSKLDRSIPRDLEIICLRCLAKDPRQRFPDCSALARDLDNWLNDLPIVSRRMASWEKLWRWGRRNPSLAALSILFITSTAIFSTGVTVQWARASFFAGQLQQTLTEKEKARAELSQSNQQLTESNDELKRAYAQLLAADQVIERQTKDVEQKEQVIRTTSQGMQEAQAKTELALAETAEERKRRLAEETKNLDFRYFSDIHTAKLSIALNQSGTAFEVLKRSDPARRSLEWQILSHAVKHATVPLTLFDGSRQLSDAMRGFISSAHFAERVLEPRHVLEFAKTTKVISVSEDQNRWLYCDTLDDLISPQLPAPVERRGSHPSWWQFPVARLRLASVQGAVPTLDAQASHAWLSPDGKCVAAITPQVTVQANALAGVAVEVRFPLRLMELDGEQVQQIVLDKPGGQSSNWSLTWSPGANALRARANPNEPRFFCGAFSADSSQFALVDGTNANVCVWSASSISQGESQRVPRALIHLEDYALSGVEAADCRFDDQKILLALPNELLTVDPQQATRSSTSYGEPFTSEQIRFSRSGRTLAFLNRPIDNWGHAAPLHLRFYNLDRRESQAITVSQQELLACAQAMPPLALPEERAAAVTRGIYAADWLNDDMVDDRENRWVSLRLASGVQLFFTRNVQSLSSPTPVWQPPTRKLVPPTTPKLLQLSPDGQALMVGCDDRLLIFKRDQDSGSWNLRVAKDLQEGGRVLSATWHPREDAVFIGQSKGIFVLDPEEGKISQRFETGYADSLRCLGRSGIGYSNEQGEVSIVSESDGTLLKSFRMQRNATSVLDAGIADGLLAAAGADRRITLWDLNRQRVIRSITGDIPISGLKLNTRAKMLSAVGLDGSVSVFQLPTLDRKAWFGPGSGQVLWTNSTDDGKRQIIVQSTGCKIFDLARGVEVLDWLQFNPPASLAVMDEAQTELYALTSDWRLEYYAR